VSLLLRERDIERAVLGELTPADEARLFEHLHGCAPCQARYDELTKVKSFVDGAAVAHARARARLVSAVEGLPSSRGRQERQERQERSRRSRWLPALFVLAPAAAIVVWIAKPAAPPNKRGDEVTMRGSADPTPTAATPTLIIYASRKTGPAHHGPVRLVAELPGSGEARVSRSDYLQLGVRGLPAAAHVRVAGLDDHGSVHDYLPDTFALPAARTSVLGRSVELARDHAPGTVKVVALFSDAPVSDGAVTDALAGRANAGVVTGTLVIEP
jgi:hypothetical protein